MQIRIPCAVFVAAGLFLAPPAPLAADHSVSVHTYSGGCCQDQAIGNSPVSISGHVGHPTGYYDYYANSTVGTVYLDLDNHSWLNSGLLDGSQANANFVCFDLFITDGTGVPKNVSIWVNVEVEAVAAYTAGSAPPLSAHASAGTVVAVNAGSQGAGWTPEGGLWTGGPSYGPFTGWSGETLAGTFAFGPFVVGTEQLNSLQMSSWLVTAPEVGWLGDWINVAASYRVGLATGTPAITVPAGFTASSGEAAIVDGWFQGSGVVDVPAIAHGSDGPRLAQNSPNPFDDATTIDFALGAPATVSLRVFDVNGRRVADLVAGARSAGTHSVTWDGRDSGGRRLPAGTYFYRLEHPGGVEARRLVLLR